MCLLHSYADVSSDYLWWDGLIFFLFFFFKQKTAYEMRISDWSSDVCSSDLSSTMKVNSSSPTVTIPCARTLMASSRSRSRIVTASCSLQPCAASQKIGRASCRERVCQYV